MAPAPGGVEPTPASPMPSWDESISHLQDPLESRREPLNLSGYLKVKLIFTLFLWYINSSYKKTPLPLNFAPYNNKKRYLSHKQKFLIGYFPFFLIT